ncbi:hypothetical protein K4K53_000375 [Colletotrichum sp. SAR 10_77]|nr:hypothetical protein K4K53_000375 [Colletotrichum sp. SAR 10_77]
MASEVDGVEPDPWGAAEGSGGQDTWGDSEEAPATAKVYDQNWIPYQTLNSIHCLGKVSASDTEWLSHPAAENTNATKVGKCSTECLSLKLRISKESISPLLLKYIKVEVHLYDAGLSNTCVGEALVYFEQMEQFEVVDLSRDDSNVALREHNPRAVAMSELIRISISTSGVTMNVSDNQQRSVNNFDKAYNKSSMILTKDLAALKEVFASDHVQMELLVEKPILQGGENLRDVLSDVFQTAFDADKNPEERPLDRWFPKSPRTHDMPLGNVPRPNGGLPSEIPSQAALVRFRNEDQYNVTHIVGAANAAFSEQAAASEVVSSELDALVIPLQHSKGHSQFIVVVLPKGADIYLPSLGEACHIRLPSVKTIQSVGTADVDQAVASLVAITRDFADYDDEEFIPIIRDHVQGVMHGSFEDTIINSLRLHSDISPEEHDRLIREFILQHRDTLIIHDADSPISDEVIWFPAERVDMKLPIVAHDAQVYVTKCPLEPKSENSDENKRRAPIAVDLPFISLNESSTMTSYMESIVDAQKGFKACIRRSTSDKTIRAEIHAINALHNPASASTPIGEQNLAAYRFIQAFQRDETTPSVDLHALYPVLGELSRLENTKTCPEKIQAKYTSLDEAKKAILSKLVDLPAGLIFIPGVAGSGKTEFIKFFQAACTFGTGTPKAVRTLYVAPNNQAVDDMAKKFQEYFDDLGLEGAPTIMRLYGLEFEIKSLARTIAPSTQPRHEYFDIAQAEESIQTMKQTSDSDADGADPAYIFLAAYQFQKLGVDFHKEKQSRSKGNRITKNVTAEAAAVSYYEKHVDRYPDLRNFLDISERDGGLEADQLREVRGLIKVVFHDMLADFDGIICTTPVVAANTTVRRFQAEFVFTDEAGRQSELSSLISVAHYNPRAWFFLGDPEQLKPYLSEAAKATENPFTPQLQVSLLKRATMAHVEIGWLDVTHRPRGSLRPLPSRMNYADRMRNPAKQKQFPISTVAFSEELSEFLGKQTAKQSRLVAQFPKSRAISNGTSFNNAAHVNWVIPLVKKLLRNPRLTGVHSDAPARILIVPLYKAQVDLYRQTLTYEHARGTLSDEDLHRIDVRTLDSSQGEERDLVIVDYVQTDKAGFCVDSNRNCLATTRAIQCEIILLNDGMVAEPRAARSKLGMILTNATDRSYKLQVLSCTNCDEPTHDENTCLKKLFCTYCKESGHAQATRQKRQDAFRCKNCNNPGHKASECPDKPQRFPQVRHVKLDERICDIATESTSPFRHQDQRSQL